MITLTFIIICLCLPYSSAVDSFSYENSKPDYVVGIEILPNHPNTTVEGGIYSISPSLSKGLALDYDTGVISGTPVEQYYTTYIVVLMSLTGTIMQATIEMNIWDVPTTLTCGLVKLTIFQNYTDSFQCKSDKKVKNWSINFNPSGSYPISITNDGIVKLNKLPPPDSPITLTVNGENPAGKSTTSTSIIISKLSTEIKYGLNMNVDDVNSFTCGNDYSIKTIYNNKKTVIDNLDGLDGEDAYSVWDTKLDGFLSSHNVLYWNYTMEGLIYAPEEGIYSFHKNSDYTTYKVYIDGELSNLKEIGYSYNYYWSYYYSYCSAWEYSNDKIDVNLTTGYHPIKIVGHYSLKEQLCEDYYYCYTLTRNSTYKFLLKWEIPGKTEEESISFYQLASYNVVSYLIFDSQYYTMPLNSYFEIPFKIERGIANECITGDDRITVDLTNHILKGQINVEGKIQLTVQCSTDTSTTNMVFVFVDIVNKYVKGIVAYYLKSDHFDNSCNNPYTTSTEGVKTEIIRLEDEINEEYNPIQSIWDGLTPNFASEFGVNWEGYLKIETAGKYVFNLTSVQGSWLSIDFIEIINHKGIHDWSSKTGTKYLSEGYHFIRVNYMKNIGASGIKLSYKNELDSSYKSLVGSLYFVPRGDFEYRVSYAVYIVNNRISDNIPYTEGNKVISECVSKPSLPPGLELSGCTIRGTPTTVQDVTSYVISGKLEDGSTVSTTIQMKVIGDTKPQGLHLIDLDNNGTKITVLNLFIGNESHLLITIDSGVVIYYKLPVIPDGFTYDEFTGSITVIATEYITNYELEIRAYYSNTEFVSTKVVTNVISGCSGEYKPHFVKVVDTRNPRARVSCKYEYDNETIIIEYVIPAGPLPLYFPVLCLIPGDYKFFASDYETGRGTFFLEFYTDGKIADRKELQYYALKIFDINTIPKSPTIEYSKNTREEYFLNEDIKIKPKIHLLDKCEISPELPSYLHFNTTNCIITGKVTKASSKQLYRVIGTNENGLSTRLLNLTFYDKSMTEVCSKQGKIIINIHVNGSDGSSPVEWTFSLFKSSDMDNENKSSLIELNGEDEQWEEGYIYKYDYCLSNDEYTAVYRGSSSSYSGYGNGFIDVLVDGIPVDRTSLGYEIMKMEKSFCSSQDYNYSTLWENSIQYEDGWDNPTTQHSIWSKSKLSEIN